MTSDRETYKDMGYACCGPWLGRNRAKFRIRIGILLLLIGFIWYGARLGWVDFTWLYTIHFWPVAVMIIGAWLIYRGLWTRRIVKSEDYKEV